MASLEVESHVDAALPVGVQRAYEVLTLHLGGLLKYPNDERHIRVTASILAELGDQYPQISQSLHGYAVSIFEDPETKLLPLATAVPLLIDYVDPAQAFQLIEGRAAHFDDDERIAVFRRIPGDQVTGRLQDILIISLNLDGHIATKTKTSRNAIDALFERLDDPYAFLERQLENIVQSAAGKENYLHDFLKHYQTLYNHVVSLLVNLNDQRADEILVNAYRQNDNISESYFRNIIPESIVQRGFPSSKTICQNFLPLVSRDDVPDGIIELFVPDPEWVETLKGYNSVSKKFRAAVVFALVHHQLDPYMVEQQKPLIERRLQEAVFSNKKSEQTIAAVALAILEGTQEAPRRQKGKPKKWQLPQLPRLPHVLQPNIATLVKEIAEHPTDISKKERLLTLLQRQKEHSWLTRVEVDRMARWISRAVKQTNPDQHLSYIWEINQDDVMTNPDGRKVLQSTTQDGTVFNIFDGDGNGFLVELPRLSPALADTLNRVYRACGIDPIFKAQDNVYLEISRINDTPCIMRNDARASFASCEKVAAMAILYVLRLAIPIASVESAS